MSPSEDLKKSNAVPEDEKDLESVGMEELLEMYDEALTELSEGEIVRGRVMQVKPNELVVDIGYKSEGLVPIDQVTDRSGEVKYKQGDEVDVFVERLEDPSGYVLLSRDKAERVIVWDQLEESYKKEEPIEGTITDRVKGGLSVDVGVKAFLPGSLVDVRPIKNLDSLKGKKFEFKIISFDKRRTNIVLSRRALLEVEYEKRKKEIFEQLEEGKVIEGAVKNITDYGAFVDLGGIDGLLHITDISWGRVNHPSEFFNVGDHIEVVVLKFDRESERVSLGYKQRRPDPWLTVGERYPVGSKVKGRVVSLTDYGAFVELEEGVEGLIHISEMSWTRRVRPSKLLDVGEQIDAEVSDVDVENRRISLSLKALEENPWDTVEERYPVGATVTGKVRNITDFGAFVEVEEGIDGLVHISDMSWTRRLNHPSDVLKKGEEVTAKVTSVDAESQRLSLSIKEFLPNEWDDYAKDRSIGDEVVGTISKITDFGLFIELSEGVEGLAHISEVERGAGESLEEIYQPGQPVRARIIKIDMVDKKIGLSLREVDDLSDDERDAFQRGELSSAESSGSGGAVVHTSGRQQLSESMFGNADLSSLK
ncbi:MAG: 30S ribosomal protein S1, partial [Thermoanaerobaculia bacterium]|nr:30S ribosomal protein S1 [Thermoanaerobaculia bacterium]